MGFLKRFFGGGATGSEGAGPDDGGENEVGLLVASEATFDAHAERHRVSVWLRLRDPAFENEREQQLIFGLENKIMRALDVAHVGEHDTNALETGFFAMRLIGDDADAIVAVVLPLLVEAPAGSYLAVRRGGAGAAEDRVEVGAGS